MKKNIFTNISLGILIVASMFTIHSCNDANYSELDTHAYIEEALSGSSTSITVLAEGETIAKLNVHLSNKTDRDNHYSLVPDQAALDSYNLKNGTSLVLLPESQYTLPSEIVVKAGEYNAETINIPIKTFSQEMIDTGESYALAVKLIAKDNSIKAMEATGKYVITTSSILKFSAPMFTSAVNLKADKYSTNPETYEQYTIEVRFQVSNTGDRDRAIFKNLGDNANFILLRFEDPQSDNNDHKRHSLVQIVGRNRIYMNPTYSFEPNKWQHLALTCDGSNYRLYINGNFAGVKEIPAGPTTFSDVNWFSRGDDNRDPWSGCKILMSEARIWSVARTELQIQNNYVSVSPSSPGLEAYWRFNEGEGNVFEDATGNGHTLTTTRTPVWIDDILSTDTSTDWK